MVFTSNVNIFSLDGIEKLLASGPPLYEHRQYKKAAF